MENLKELSFEEMVEVDGGILPIIAGVVIGAGKLAGWTCGLLAADIILNFNTYSERLDAKLAECK